MTTATAGTTTTITTTPFMKDKTVQMRSQTIFPETERSKTSKVPCEKNSAIYATS
jgi:hypothetical protein